MAREWEMRQQEMETGDWVQGIFPTQVLNFPNAEITIKTIPLLLGSFEHGDETGLAEEGQHHDGTGGKGEEGKNQGKFAEQEGEQDCDTKHEPTEEDI